MEIQINSLDDLKLAVQSTLPLIKKAKIVLFYGEMGVGKTTFIIELLRQLGIENPEGSPTYSLVNEYKSREYGKIYHLDLFRLKSVEEAYDIGIEELLDENQFCFIEWPQKIENLVQSGFLALNFELLEGQQRRISTN